MLGHLTGSGVIDHPVGGCPAVSLYRVEGHRQGSGERTGGLVHQSVHDVYAPKCAYSARQVDVPGRCDVLCPERQAEPCRLLP